MNRVNKIVKRLEILNTGGSLSMVPYELAKEIVDAIDIDWSDPTKTFKDPWCGSAMFLLAVAEKLQEHGHTPEHIVSKMLFGSDIDEIQVMIAKKALKWFSDVESNIEQKDALEEDMKEFNVTLGNPPFSLTANKKGKKGGSSKLYDKFFAKAVETSEAVAMIMPTTDKWMRSKHNDLIRKTASHIEYISSDTFNTVHIPMWYVIVDSSDNTPDIAWPGYDPLPKQLYFWAKGKVSSSNSELVERKVRRSDNDIAVYHKINSINGLVMGYTNKKNIKPTKLFPDTGYAVLMPQQINVNRGWTNTKIVKCNGMQAGMNGMNIAFVNSKKEAVELVELMKTQEFIDQAVKNMGGMNNMTLNAMMSIDMEKVKEAAL